MYGLAGTGVSQEMDLEMSAEDTSWRALGMVGVVAGGKDAVFKVEGWYRQISASKDPSGSLLEGGGTEGQGWLLHTRDDEGTPSPGSPR